MADIIVGIEIGVKTTEIGFADLEGKIFEKSLLHSDAYPIFSSFAEAMVMEIKEVLKIQSTSIFSKAKVKAIGMAAPGANSKEGTLAQGVNLPWEVDMDLPAMFQKEFKTRVEVVNDATAVCVAESFYGACKDIKDCIVITIGEGVGMGIIANDKLVLGHDGFAGEGGHMIVREDGRNCGCGRSGCVETYVSNTGLKLTAEELRTKHAGNSILNDISTLTDKVIFKAVELNDDLAIKILDETAQVLALAIANMATVTNPEKVILYGGVAKAGEIFIKAVNKHLPKYLLFGEKNDLRVSLSELHDENAVLLGAIAATKQ
ncbi:MAG: glucokinase [Saprospiraceae bacterium]|jgi:glucokinase